MSVTIEEIFLNKKDDEEYHRSDCLIIKARLKNQADLKDKVLIQAILKSTVTVFPTSLRQGIIPLGPNEELFVPVFDLEIDDRFLTDDYAVCVEIAKQWDKGNRAEKTFRVRTEDSLTA